MNDYVDSGDEHQMGGRKALDATSSPKSLFDLARKLPRHGRHLTGRASRRNHHVIGDVRFSGQGNGNDLLGLIVVERLEHQTVEVIYVDGSVSGFAAGGLSGTFGQGVSSMTEARRDSLAAAQAGAIGDASWGPARVRRLLTSDRAAGEGK